MRIIAAFLRLNYGISDNIICIYVTASGSNLAILNAKGVLRIRNNWIKPGWVASHSGLSGQLFNDRGTIAGQNPGFLDEAAQNLQLATDSACIDHGAALETGVLPNYDLTRQYVKHQRSVPRPRTTVLDIGAFEAGSLDPVPLKAPTNLKVVPSYNRDALPDTAIPCQQSGFGRR